jgi:Fuc2NAc and GlcNAc transferase
LVSCCGGFIVIEIVTIAVAPIIAWFVTAAAIRRARKTGLLDLPNARSSHVQPTPRGGGIGFVVAVCFASLALAASGAVDWRAAAICLGPGAVIALVGYVDDRRGLSARLRFGVQFTGATMVLALCWPLPDTIGASWSSQMFWTVFWIVAICWLTNLYNFMDGVDGLAASEAVFVFGGAAGLVLLVSGSSGWASLLFAAAFAVCGFLSWNWPPAKTFMGDVGSGFLGFMAGSFALLSWVTHVLSPFTWLILASLFVSDATVTLLRRMAQGEKWYSAHRSHAYQWLGRTRLGHLGVTRLCWVWNLFVVLPLACWSALDPARSVLLAGAILGVTFVMVVALGAGRPERV